MNRRTTVLLALLVVVLFATGCKNLEETFTPEPRVVTQEATRAASGVQVVGDMDADVPEDLPLWPAARVIESSKTDDAFGLTLATRDAFNDVVAGVAAGFEDAGWSIAREEAGEEGARMAILEISRDSEQGLVTLTQADNGLTQIDYVLTMSEQ